MIESGSPITIDNTSGVVTLTPALPAAAPAAHTDSVHSGASANLLTALTPTFAGWDINPGTNANLVDELSSAALTTAGTNAAGVATITYNLGDSRRRIAYIQLNSNIGSPQMHVSDDNSTYHTLTATDVAVYNMTGIGKFQYLRFSSTAAGYTGIKMRCYNID